MQKLSSTWRQQKQIGSRQQGGQNLVKNSTTAASNRSVATKVHQPCTKTVKRLGQHVIPVGTGSRNAGQPVEKFDRRETDLNKQREQTIGQSYEGALRRSPRLKNGKEKENGVGSTASIRKKSAVSVQVNFCRIQKSCGVFSFILKSFFFYCIKYIHHKVCRCKVIHLSSRKKDKFYC